MQYTGTSQAAIMVINTGGRDIVIDKLTIRGQEATWNGAVQNITYAVTDQSISQDLTFVTTNIVGFDIGTAVGVEAVPNLASATSDITLQSGKTIIIYICSPDSITINDIGLTAAITIFTSQAMYYKETNVQAV